jgi:hypothetical protein
MKKKSTSQSAFFNLRVLIGLFVVLFGVFLAFFGGGIVSSPSVLAQGNGASHKLSVRDRQLAESLKVRGARVVAD